MRTNKNKQRGDLKKKPFSLTATPKKVFLVYSPFYARWALLYGRSGPLMRGSTFAALLLTPPRHGQGRVVFTRLQRAACEICRRPPLRTTWVLCEPPALL